MTRRPSVTGEGVQGGLSSWVGSFSFQVTPDCQSNLPVRRSKHITVRRVPVSIAWVMKTRPPHTTGVELPRSGNATRQRTFSFVLQRSGRFFPAATPLPSGPRKPGQFAAETDAVSTHQSQQTARHRHVRQILAASHRDVAGMDNGTRLMCSYCTGAWR
jgi:hypothetical protein